MESVLPRPQAALRSGPRHAVRRRRHPLRRFVAVAAIAVTAFVVTGSALAYSALQGNITTHDVSEILGGDRPSASGNGPVDPRAGRALNILVMGSDVRSGENAALGGSPETAGMRSDTTLVVHVAADRSRADLVSIPRDLLVDIPTCPLPDGSESSPRSDAMFNSAFATGSQGDQVEYAAACTIRTVEQMTGVYIDDFVVVDFAAFTRMVDALGGIPMCIPEPVSDRYAGLDLDAGYQTLDGTDALAYARARKNIGDGSDISRIGRQQLLLGAMVRQVLSKDLLTDLPSLYQFLDAATASLTTGPTIGQIPTMVGIANSLRSVPADGVSFVTVPFDWSGARVRPNADSAELWAAIAADRPITTAQEPEPSEPDVTLPTDSTATEAASPDTAGPAPAEQPWDIVTGEDEAGVCG